MADGRARPGQPMQPSLDDQAGKAAVLRVYRQAFAVLAREAEKMILTPQLLDVDETIFTAFAASGSDCLTEEQVRTACRRSPVARRFEVLKGYGRSARSSSGPTSATTAPRSRRTSERRPARGDQDAPAAPAAEGAHWPGEVAAAPDGSMGGQQRIGHPAQDAECDDGDEGSDGDSDQGPDDRS